MPATAPAAAQSLIEVIVGAPITVSVASAASATASVTVSKPSGGWLSGNFLLAVVSTEGVGTVPTTPAGWTLVTSGTSGVLLGAAVFSLQLTSAGAASYTFAGAAGTLATSAVVAEYVIAAVDASATANGVSSTATWAAVSNATANERVILALAANTATISGAWPNGVNVEGSQTGVAAVSYLADSVQAASGTTGTPAVTLSASDNWVALTVSLLNLLPVRVAQSGQEIVGAAPNPPVNVSQSFQEIVGASANPQVNVAQAFQEIVQSTVVIGATPPTVDPGVQARRYAQFFVPKAPWPRLQNKQAELRQLVPGFDPGRAARRFWQHFVAAPLFARNTKLSLGPPPPPYVPTTDTGHQSRWWTQHFYKPPFTRAQNKLQKHSAVAPPPPTALLVDGVVTKNLTSATIAGPLNVAGLVRKALNSGTNASSFGVDGLIIKRLISRGATTSWQADAVVRKTLCLAIPAVAQTAPFVYSNDFGAIPLFPTLPESFPIKVSPGLDTIVGTTKSLREMRYAQRTTPLWDIEVPFEELRDQTQNQAPYGPFTGFVQYQQLVQTWLMMYGQSNVFAFEAPWDNSRTNQTIGTGDGATWSFQIYSTWGLGAQAQLLPVGYVNAISAVYVNGVLVPTTRWTFSRDKLYFISANGMIYPPVAGATISLTFSYYYLCRFTEDEQDFEEFAKNRWVVRTLKFRGVLWL